MFVWGSGVGHHRNDANAKDLHQARRAAHATGEFRLPWNFPKAPNQHIFRLSNDRRHGICRNGTCECESGFRGRASRHARWVAW